MTRGKKLGKYWRYEEPALLAALAAGATRYTSELPCGRHGAPVVRSAANTDCCECKLAAAREQSARRARDKADARARDLSALSQERTRFDEMAVGESRVFAAVDASLAGRMVHKFARVFRLEFAIACASDGRLTVTRTA